MYLYRSDASCERMKYDLLTTKMLDFSWNVGGMVYNVQLSYHTILLLFRLCLKDRKDCFLLQHGCRRLLYGLVSVFVL